MTGAKCKYTHDVSNETKFPDLNDTWKCPREVVSDSDYCLFHSRETHPARRDANVTEEFLADITSTTKSKNVLESAQNRFIGVKLPELDLAFTVLRGETTYPIDLRDATVRGDIDCHHAIISYPLLLDGILIRGGLRFQSAKLHSSLRIQEASISDGVFSDDTNFVGPVTIKDTQLRGPFALREASCGSGLTIQNCSIYDKCVLHGTDIDGPLRFTDTQCRSPLNLEEIIVSEDATFDRLHCRGSLRVSGATFQGRATFGDAQIEGVAQFTKSSFQEKVNFNSTRIKDRGDFRFINAETASFDNTDFEGPARFDGTKVSTASYTNARFHGETSFTGITAREELDLRSISMDSCLEIDQAVIDRIRIKNTHRRPNDVTHIISLKESMITTGVLHVHRDSVYYDVSYATLGDIEIYSDDDYTAVFENFCIKNTTFDGFDFSNYENELRKIKWRLHTTEDGFQSSFEDYTSREKTYLKAKKGAERVGATRAAAEFFRHEQLNRRHAHLERAMASPIGSKKWGFAWYQWLSNRVFEISSGYGERPRATIQTTLITIGGFTGIYWFLLPAPPYDIGVAGYLLFSLASFVTLVLGSVTPPSDPLVQFIAQVEGLLGAFLIALFVFTLTRSVHR